MGNDISSIPLFESNIRKYGEWEDGKQCCDDQLKKKVKKIIWKSCPLTNDFLLGLTHFTKTKICKIPSTDDIVQDLTHDFIEVHIECENEDCKMKEEKSFCEIFEYGSDGVHRSVGKYRKIFKEVNSFIPKNIDYLTLYLMDFKFKEIFKASDYDFLRFNCKTFAKSLYSKLVENEKATNEVSKLLAGTSLDPNKMINNKDLDPVQKELVKNNFNFLFLAFAEIGTEIGLFSQNKK